MKPKSHNNTDWTPVAGWYDRLVGEEGSEYHQQVVLPGALRLLAPRAGQRVVDVACGQGVLCRLLAGQGVDVVGVDAARSLIAAARERERTGDRATGRKGKNASEVSAEKLGRIEYRVGDARDLSFLAEESFDLAACVLAIQNIHPIAPVFAGISRILRPGGKCVTVMMHPCFRAPGQSSWGWDEQGKVQYRRIDGYLLPRKKPIVTHPGQAKDLYTWTFHKPIQDYVKALSRAGLLIDAMEEWPSHKTSNSGPRAPAENSARQEIPMFLAIRAVKLADCE